MDRRGVGKVVWQRCFAAFIPELPETFSLGMLKREIHCVHDNGLPLLHSIMAHPFLVAELARLSATNDQRCGRLLSKHALEIYLILRTKISLILYLQSRFGMEASLKLIFFMGQLFFPRVFQCRDYEKENFFIRVTQIWRAISFSKESSVCETLETRTMDLFKLLVIPYYSIYKKNKHASVTFYVYTFHFSEYSLLPRLNDPPNPPPWKEIIFITTERGHLSPPRNKTELNLVRDEEKYYPGISSN